ncbi:MAG: NUDIX hydrolase, partial [Acidimicrobiales bacterium]
AEEASLALSLETLVPLSFWLPPPETPRRFATWFFLAPVPDGDVLIDIVVDGQEIFEHRWVRPRVALEERDKEAIRLAPPTYMTLWGLSRHRDAISALRSAGRGEPERFLTRGVTRPDGGLLVVMWEGDAAYEDGDLERAGPRRRLWLEPSGWRVEASP